MKFLGLMVAVIAAWLSLSSATAIANTEIKREVDAVIDDVISWRRDFHEHAELSNREFRTAKVIAEHLRYALKTHVNAIEARIPINTI